jgi:hypothetical protein
MKKYTLFVFVLGLLIACNTAPSAKTEVTTTEKPSLNEFSIGEKWTWIEKSMAGEQIRWEGEEQLEVVDFNGNLGFWHGSDTVLISTNLDQEQSSTPFRDWPLKVGKKWKYESEWKNAEGTAMITSQDVEVVSYGEVTVLAGRFMAYKIEHTGTFTNTNSGSGKMNDTYWYSPALKMNIRHTQDDGYGSYVLELYGYKSGQNTHE